MLILFYPDLTWGSVALPNSWCFWIILAITSASFQVWLAQPGKAGAAMCKL